MEEETKQISADIIHLLKPNYVAENSCLKEVLGDKYANCLKKAYYVSHAIVEPEDLLYQDPEHCPAV